MKGGAGGGSNVRNLQTAAPKGKAKASPKANGKAKAKSRARRPGSASGLKGNAKRQRGS